MVSSTEGLLLVQTGIGAVSWLQLVLSMNRFRGCAHFHRADLWALIIMMHASLLRWIGVMSTRTMSFTFQVIASNIAAMLTWCAFIVVFNNGFRPPTRQQAWVFVLSLAITSLWGISDRLLVEWDGA